MMNVCEGGLFASDMALMPEYAHDFFLEMMQTMMMLDRQKGPIGEKYG
jgi:hypothetical protein